MVFLDNGKKYGSIAICHSISMNEKYETTLLVLKKVTKKKRTSTGNLCRKWLTCTLDSKVNILSCDQLDLSPDKYFN